MTDQAPDVALFAEHLRWFAHRHLRDRSRWGVAVWIAARLHPKKRERWTRQWKIEHETHARAERDLVTFLRTSVTARASCIRLVELPDRHVDWVATSLRPPLGQLRPAPPYVSRRSRPLPDGPLLATLAGLAESWAIALDLAADGGHDSARNAALQDRARKLRKAAALHEAHRAKALPFNERLFDRLRRVGDEGAVLARTLAEALSFWERAFAADMSEDAAFRAFGESLQKDDMANLDTLLEFSAALSIARIATEPDDSKDAWKLSPVSLAEKRAYPSLVLHRGALRCEITKGMHVTPNGRAQHRDISRSWLDEVLTGGEEHSIGHQPDIVLRFSHRDDRARALVAIADAKRNVAGDGQHYLRHSIGSAAMYMIAFAHMLGLKVSDGTAGSDPTIRTALTPAVTLFCFQQLGERAKDANRMTELFGSHPERVPSVVALNLRDHFGHAPGGSWRSPVLTAWFRLLTRQVEAHFAPHTRRGQSTKYLSSGAGE